MKLYYWSPFISNIATEKAVVNSIKSVKKFSKEKINPYLLDTIGEWDIQKKNLTNNNIRIIDLLNFKLLKYLPKYGFFRSRFSYIVVFFFSIFKLHKILKKDKPEYLMIHLMTFIPLLLLLFFNYETKFILRISGYPKLNYLRSFFWKIVGKKVYFITTPTIATMDLLKKFKIFDFNKIKYLPDPILNIDEIKKKKLDDNTNNKKIFFDKIIVSIGRLTKQKNFEFLVEAFNKIIDEYPNFTLFILGEGEKRKKLEKQIKKLNLENKVFLIGHEKNIYKYLKRAEMFILSSLWEDPGFVLVEAGYSNTIVLSSDCPNGPKEILNNSQNGFLYRKNSLISFVEKFKEIQNMNEEQIFKKKLLLKKKIKEFTLFNHYKILSLILSKK